MRISFWCVRKQQSKSAAKIMAISLKTTSALLTFGQSFWAQKSKPNRLRYVWQGPKSPG
jgi:hypothetical protein